MNHYRLICYTYVLPVGRSCCGADLLDMGDKSLVFHISLSYTSVHFLELYISKEGIRNGLEPLLFIGIGTFVAAMVIAPATGPQAFAAGLGWTDLLSSPPL